MGWRDKLTAHPELYTQGRGEGERGLHISRVGRGKGTAHRVGGEGG